VRHLSPAGAWQRGQGWSDQVEIGNAAVGSSSWRWWARWRIRAVRWSSSSWDDSAYSSQVDESPGSTAWTGGRRAAGAHRKVERLVPTADMRLGRTGARRLGAVLGNNGIVRQRVSRDAGHGPAIASAIRSTAYGRRAASSRRPQGHGHQGRAPERNAKNDATVDAMLKAVAVPHRR
jgi:hypothetical protein